MNTGRKVLLSTRSLWRKCRGNFGDAGVFHRKEFVFVEYVGRVDYEEALAGGKRLCFNSAFDPSGYTLILRPND